MASLQGRKSKRYKARTIETVNTTLENLINETEGCPHVILQAVGRRVQPYPLVKPHFTRTHNPPPKHWILLAQLRLGTKAVFMVAHEAARDVLRKRLAHLAVDDGGVAVSDARRGNHDRSACRELNNELPLPQDKVSSASMVVVPEAVDGAPRKYPVEKIVMKISTDLITKIKGDGGIHAVGKGSLEVGIFFLQVA